jgi:glyoxylase-like metal-dependent hydrolase (beta-lactamase superfamily II)
MRSSFLNPTLIRLFGLGLLSAGLWVAYSQFGTAPSKLSTVKIKDDLFVIHNDFVPGNTTALITNEGVILVDDKFEIDYANIVAAVKKLTNQPIKYVINTHHHGDHSGGNAAAQKASVTAIAHENALQNMLDGKQPGVANIGVGNHSRIRLGGKDAEIFYFGRSHTNGDISVYFPAQRTLATGDMFTFGDATPELIDYAGGGSAKEWPATVHNALRLDFDTVVPGHGVVTTKAELAKYERSTITLRNRVHDMIVAKKTRAEMVEVMKKEFHWADLHVNASMDGAMVELR